ncbi:MAG: hypothetical protein JEY99_05185 [Spirochaetales bacterium]|nr:hypothetical protein [Spirochaetales bacterium]
MNSKQESKISCIADAVGGIPYRMAFAGGWIDQPFVSGINPDPTGSMVVVNIHPDFRFMDRCGMATSSRKIARKIWGDEIPEGNPETLVKELYRAENQGLSEPSGSQDMVGLIYTGVSRIDYSIQHEGGYFPVHVENNNDERVARWLEQHVKMVPVCPRPAGYNPLETRNLDPELVRDLGQTGRDCYDAILEMDSAKLGESMNRCMDIWENLMPGIVHHSTLTVDLKEILKAYQAEFHGAMYSGCGGGYLYVVAEGEVPGGIAVRVRTSDNL